MLTGLRAWRCVNYTIHNCDRSRRPTLFVFAIWIICVLGLNPPMLNVEAMLINVFECLYTYLYWWRLTWNGHRAPLLVMVQHSSAKGGAYQSWCMHFYPHDAMLARVIAIASCLSVSLSWAGILSKRRRLASWFLHLLVAPMTLVFWCQISSQNSKGFPPNGASKKGGVGKFSDFLALSVNISKTVANTAKVTISD